MSSTSVCAASCTGASASPRRRGAKAHLRGRFLAGDIDDPRAGSRHGGAGLDQKRRLADARLAADQRRRPGHEAAASDPVEFGDPGGDPRLGLRGARQILEREGPARRAAPRRSPADAERRGFLDDRVPLAAGFALALPALRDRPAILADIGRAKLGHGPEVAALSRPVEDLNSRCPLRRAAQPGCSLRLRQYVPFLAGTRWAYIPWRGADSATRRLGVAEAGRLLGVDRRRSPHGICFQPSRRGRAEDRRLAGGVLSAFRIPDRFRSRPDRRWSAKAIRRRISFWSCAGCSAR